MSFRFTMSLSALSLAVLSGPSLADVTAAQAWDDWKSYMQGFGYEMSGTETVSGDTLTISDIVMAYDLPEDAGDLSITMGDFSFTDTGSGTVSVALPTEMPVAFDLTPKDGESAKGVVMITQTNPVMIVSGEENDLTYTTSANSMSMTLDSLEVGGQPLPATLFDIAFSLTDLSNITRMQVGNIRSYTQTMGVSEMSYTIKVDIPEGPDAGKIAATGGASGLSYSGSGTLPIDIDVSDMDAMLAAGFSFDGEFAYSSGNVDMDALTPDGAFVATSSTGGGAAKIAMGTDGLVYDVSQNDLKVSAEKIPNFPFPVNLEMARSAFKFIMPLQAKDEEQDFAFGMTFGDFSISDVIWNLFDPSEQLPRDPATISLDLSGKAKVLVNLMDPEQAALIDNGTVPGELNALNINSILVSAVGAELAGNGAFTFDNSDTVTFDGLPKPTGAVDITLSGANKLMDTLVEMGMLPQEQALGARMMMGLFGVAQGDDVLTSKVEVNSEGHVLANGQRLR